MKKTRKPIDPRERVTFDRLLWITVCLGLALLAHIAALPVWVLATVIVAATVRLVSAARGQDAPPQFLRLGISIIAVGWLFFQLRTFNGLTAGTALLSLMAGLKLLEARTRRDVYVICLAIYFLSLAALLGGESFWMLSYLTGVCWLTNATLLRVSSSGLSEWRSNLRYAGRILLQALPLALVLWLFFPRFGGPLWQIPNEGGATSGLSDSMSPGDINDLALSDEVAFRVRFHGPVPPAEARYWRGPVLHDFDGHTWRRTDTGAPRAPPPLAPLGPAYQYTVSLEPNNHNWLFVLDWPSQWDVPRASLTSDYMLVQLAPVSQPQDVTATSYSHVRAVDPLSTPLRKRDIRLPLERNPRTLKLSQDLRAAHPNDLDYIHAVLDIFRTQPFYYTLTPPILGQDSVDDFLFDTKRGFCGHYASAFAALMRAAGIPARIVTGYQGGTYNRFADYWILRQSDGHAWTEVWIEGSGWLRVDPTSSIAPERVERGLTDTVTAGQPMLSRWQQQHTPWLADTHLRLDALRQLWRQRILRFNEGSQEKLLSMMHIPAPDGQKLVVVLAAGLVLTFLWLTWQVKRELNPPPTDAVSRAFDRMCRRLRKLGFARQNFEGAEDFAARVAIARPDLAAMVLALCRRYTTLRYGARQSDAANAAFIAAVRVAMRSFKPRKARSL